AVFETYRDRNASPWSCSTGEGDFLSKWYSSIPAAPSAPISNAGQIKTMRLAQSCNGEYSNFFGATSAAQVSLVLAAFNATLTRSNGVYEKDLGVHLNL